MKLQDLYSKPIMRAVNPAVSATNLDPETERVEIEEYVFTEEILNGLYRILNALKDNKPYEHVGIWIDGYYGSGKSHFLKYLDYCITPSTRDKALERFMETVKEMGVMNDLCFGYSDATSLASWLKTAEIDTCIFNLETSYDNNISRKESFLHVFWNEFNARRGFNKFNITLAQLLEKRLSDKGLFEQFKQRIAEEGDGVDWNDPSIAADIVDQELGWVLDIAQELDSKLDKESVRHHIINRDYAMSIEYFCMELSSYLKTKGDNYRLVFLADEVSQFINKEHDRYLNLQEIITKMSEACDNKIWVACTAQQDLSEILDDCHIADEMDKEGKIKGRFEVKVSLKGTKPEVITQKRILDKKEEVKPILEEMYEKQKAAFGLQFKLPTSYTGYESMDDFVAYYPFVPYQFNLIMQVFNSFLQLGYVAKEVKGNERSIIKVVHSTAKKVASNELGRFVSFDELYNNMFEEGLQARGQHAVENAERMAATYTHDPVMAKRVADILFMICNISKTDQLVFPSTIDNITSLLVNDMETPRLNIKNEVDNIMQYFCDNNIIRRIQGKNGTPDTFSFYSEEEMKVAQLIKASKPDSNKRAEYLKSIIFKSITVNNKEQYFTRSFSVGAVIMQRNFLSNNPDVAVEFAVDNEYDSPEMMAMNNIQNRLVYYMGEMLHANKRLYNSFYWYCQVNSYMETPVQDEENKNTRAEFTKRTKELLDNEIVPGIQKILDSCPLISGQIVIDDAELSSKKGTERYTCAMQKHLSSIYTKAQMVGSGVIPTTTDKLKDAIRRKVQPGDYDGIGEMLTAPENEIEIYLNKQFEEVNVSDIVAKFAKAPYGWNQICTLYVLNELVRRHARDYSYQNNPNVDVNTVAANLITETNKFTVRKAKAIPQEIIQGFIEAWKNVFGTTDSFGTADSTELFRQSREDERKGLSMRRDAYRKHLERIGNYKFATPLKQAAELFDEWLKVRNPVDYFKVVIAKQQEAHDIIDRCREVVSFIHEQLDNYNQVITYVHDNKNNFPFVPIQQQDKVSKLLEIETDEWPIDNLRIYLNMQKQVAYALEDVRKNIRENIKASYNAVCDQLEKVAQKQNVPLSILTNRNSIIPVKCAPTEILVLDSNLQTDAFYNEEINKIFNYTSAGSNNDSNEEKTNTSTTHKVRTASLKTKTSVPIKTTEDIDRYLDNLRTQLETLLEDSDGVMIIK